MNPLIPVILVAATISLTSCTEPKQSTPKVDQVEQTVTIPTSQTLNQEPSPVIFVPEAYKTLKAGDTVTLQALVGGTPEPFNDTYAIFTVTNKTAEAVCCPSCADDDSMKASVQITDSSGTVLKTSAKGFSGLASGKKVTVTGTVAETYQAGTNLIINSTGIFVHTAK